MSRLGLAVSDKLYIGDRNVTSGLSDGSIQPAPFAIRGDLQATSLVMRIGL
jgi:hypothetical protein